MRLWFGTALLLFSVSAAAETQYWVVVGSFQDKAIAETVLQKASMDLLHSYQIQSAETPKGLFYRVLEGPYLTRQVAQRSVQDAASAGYAGAWLFASQELFFENFDDTSRYEDDIGVDQRRSYPAREPAPVEPPAEAPAGYGLHKLEGAGPAPAGPSGQASATRQTSPGATALSATAIVGSGEVVALHGALENDTDVKVDGRLDEPVWATLPAYDDFVVLEPDTLQPGVHATRVKLLYTDRGLYVAAEMEQPPETLIKRLSGRDRREINRDSFNLTLDTTGEGSYAFWFGVNLGDSLMDGTALPERQFSNEWDGPWLGASATTDWGWTVEMFIPWGTVSMPQADQRRRMGVYASRKVAYLDERWGWPALPNTQPKFLSALQQVEMEGVAPRQQYNIYPFSSVTYDRIDEETRYKVGADVFWRPSSNFQTNATFNPDFGAVESDDVVINLTATETFFPEKRLFFLEGQEIFVASPRADSGNRGVGQGSPPYTMVNTRRIGGKPAAPDLPPGVVVSSRELVQPVDLEGAVKFTGQLGGFRYGVLGAFEKDVKLEGLDSSLNPVSVRQDGSDYGIARLLYQTNSGGSYKAFGVLSTMVKHYDGDAVAHGADGHYQSSTGDLKIDGQAFTSDVDQGERGYGGFVDFEYAFRQGVTQRLGIEYFDEHINLNDLGFLPRNDRLSVRTAHTRTSSDLRWARDNQFDVRGSVSWNNANLFTGGGVFVSNRATFDNLTQLTVRATWRPTAYDDLNSFGNGAYRIDPKASAGVNYQSDSTKAISYSLGFAYEGEDLGGSSFI
ncbi:MAG: DUF5916 domain-containing protein, partial [Proteobacteria bacterium]|nr:DUF5916 domain-containing protein [Pseudomonadota bacterium]